MTDEIVNSKILDNSCSHNVENTIEFIYEIKLQSKVEELAETGVKRNIKENKKNK